MGFRTKLDYSDNRQIKQYEKSHTYLSGGTSFGMVFSALTVGPDLTTKTFIGSASTVISTFSGNNTTTNYTWYDARMNSGILQLSAITPSTSATTQNVFNGYSATSSTIIDGNLVNLTYSLTDYDLTPIALYSLGGGNYSGSVQSESVFFSSAGTLDYTGRTIWVDVSGTTRTKELIIENNAVSGATWTCIDGEGKGSWVTASAATSGIWVAGTGLNSARLNGGGNIASGDYSVAEGFLTIASNYGAHAEGGSSLSAVKGGTATGIGSHAEGLVTSATTNGAHAEGSTTLASGNASHAEGSGTIASGSASHAEGSGTIASGNYSHAEGSGTIASGTSSHAEGFKSIASGEGSHAEGGYVSANLTGGTASGNGSHAEGLYTLASGIGAHSEGWGSEASGGASHAEGNETLASGSQSHAEGSNTTASGNFSHTEGLNTTASGDGSHAGGTGSTASGTTSFVHGANSIAGAENTIVFGANITGTTANTTYVDRLNVKTVGSTAFANDIRIDANGNLTTNTSDERLKENINQLYDALATIKALQGVSYQWKDRNAGGDTVRLGFIAQQVDSVDTRLAFTNPVDGFMGLHIDGIIPLLVEATKELENGITSSDSTQNKIIIPTYTPTSSTDINGNLGNITMDDNYLYIKTSTEWKRTNLESF